MGIFNKSKETAREISKKISDGVKDPQHLGAHSYESLTQEVISLANTKPMFRDTKWHKRSRNVRANILNKISHGEQKFQGLILELNKVEEMR